MTIKSSLLRHIRKTPAEAITVSDFSGMMFSYFCCSWENEEGNNKQLKCNWENSLLEEFHLCRLFSEDEVIVSCKGGNKQEVHEKAFQEQYLIVHYAVFLFIYFTINTIC